MRKFTLFFLDLRLSPSLRAVTYDAESVARAIELVRLLKLGQRCDLWSEGSYICSLSSRPGRGGSWLVVSRDEEPAWLSSSMRSA